MADPCNDVEQYCDLARIAEKNGYTGIGLGDHLVTPRTINSAYPYTHDGALLWDPNVLFPDMWQMIAAMAAVTSTLEFITATYILPLRDVFTAAKAISTAAVVSGNRVKCGVGVGWMAEEFPLTGQPFAHRGARADEMLEAIEKLLRGGMVEYHGRHLAFPPVQMSPVPSAPVPILIGGESDIAMRRAAKWNGWISAPLDGDLGHLPSTIARLAKARRETEAAKELFEIAVIMKRIPDLDLCRRLESLGVTSVLLNCWYQLGHPICSVDFKRGTMEEFADNVIAKMN